MTDVQYQQALALFNQGRHAEGARLLVQAAEAGHVPSMSLLGGQLLSGRGMPPDTVAGIRLTMAAAERGGAFACATAASLCARGYSGAPDWPRALDYLQRSAELGFQPAQAQLRLLSGYKAGIDWKKLRRAIDIAAWRSPPAPLTLSEDPPIHAAPGLLSPELCDALIARARPFLTPAKIYNELKGGRTVEDIRRHSSAQFQATDTDLVMLAVCERLCALAGLPAVQAETCQVLHYTVGEYFGPHSDFFEPGFEGHAAMLKDYGQRVVTVLVYLNDDLEGGETDFPKLGLRHRGGKGDALMFRNVDAEGRPDRRTLHAGLPPTRGEKWLLSLWIRDRAPPGYGDARVLSALESR
ncbi:MAG: 2OG-Fe(II) oxygenase [Caulobacteraceae bacterium]